MFLLQVAAAVERQAARLGAQESAKARGALAALGSAEAELRQSSSAGAAGRAVPEAKRKEETMK